MSDEDSLGYRAGDGETVSDSIAFHPGKASIGSGPSSGSLPSLSSVFVVSSFMIIFIT